RGLPILERGAVVAFGPAGEARQITLALEDDLPSDVTPAIAAADAATVAASDRPARARAAHDRRRQDRRARPRGRRLGAPRQGSGLPDQPGEVADARR